MNSDIDEITELLKVLAKKYPSDNIVNIIYNARKFVSPTADVQRHKMTNKDILTYLTKYSKKK